MFHRRLKDIDLDSLDALHGNHFYSRGYILHSGTTLLIIESNLQSWRYESNSEIRIQLATGYDVNSGDYMEHSFRPSIGNPLQCVVCGYQEISHTSDATCEACGLQGACDFLPRGTEGLKHPKKMLLCPSCEKKELDLARRLTEERVKAHESIKTPGDYFNAKIPAVVELRTAIDNDPNIPAGNKSYELAKAMQNRLIELSKSIFELDTTRATMASEHREIQVNLNHLMKELSDERQKELNLKDITYSPKKAPVAKKPKAPTVKKISPTKASKEEIAKACADNDIEEFILRGIMQRRQVSITDAVRIYNEIQTREKLASNES